jgi:hypothetical protein
MIYQDHKNQLDNQRILVEYLASFWNPEAVKKIQESRNNSSKHKFKENAEFEEHILSGEYKNNPLLDVVKKLKEMDVKKDIKSSLSNKRGRLKGKLPTDLSTIHSTLEKFK